MMSENDSFDKLFLSETGIYFMCEAREVGNFAPRRKVMVLVIGHKFNTMSNLYMNNLH